MTCDEGYARAKHETPGYVVAMGPEHAEVKRVRPIGWLARLAQIREARK